MSNGGNCCANTGSLVRKSGQNKELHFAGSDRMHLVENNARADFSPASRELADSVAQRGFDSAYHGLFAGAPKSSYLLVFLDTARVSNI